MKNKNYFIFIITCLILFFSFNAAYADTIEATGWGWIGTSSGTDATPGLISYNCENLDEYYITHGGYLCGSAERPDYSVVVNTSGYISGSAWIGISDDSGGLTSGWMRFSDDPTDYLITGESLPTLGGEVVTGTVYNDLTGEVSGWARIMTLGEYGYDTFGSNEWGWVKLRGTWGGSGTYGVTFDTTERTFDGWAWNGGDGGFGLIDFSFSVTEIPVMPAWLQTLQGDIYSQLGISISQSSPECNASYFILSNGSISDDFCTSLTDGIIDNYGTLYFPADDSGVYRSNIGKIDLNSLNNRATEIASISEIGNPLDANVYKTASDFSINNESLLLLNGDVDTAGTFGNGTVIVNGDLDINQNIYYSDANISDIRELSSVAWIVTGNLNIAPYVTNLSGAFIVLGDNGITTGDGNQQLIVNGLMMARAFDFGRTRIREEEENVPSEKIIYDGRALANTPPGLEDLVATLPELGIAD